MRRHSGDGPQPERQHDRRRSTGRGATVDHAGRRAHRYAPKPGNHRHGAGGPDHEVDRSHRRRSRRGHAQRRRDAVAQRLGARASRSATRSRARPPAPRARRSTQTSSFRTFRPSNTFAVKILRGLPGQTYGVGMPIVLYFSRPVTEQAAVERALQIRTSRPVVGAWYWDSQCGLAPVCLYFRPRHYWPAHTQVSFIGHLNGVKAAPGVFGDHTLTQTFTIGRLAERRGQHGPPLHGRLPQRTGCSRTGRSAPGGPGTTRPNGTYLTIEKANPVDMVGPGYSIEVPWSVRFTWSGDYLHDAYWSVGEQGFTNVSHGCVNMPPADAEIFYKMADPGRPGDDHRQPRGRDVGQRLDEWFLSWRRGCTAARCTRRCGPARTAAPSSACDRCRSRTPARPGPRPARFRPTDSPRRERRCLGVSCPRCALMSEPRLTAGWRTWSSQGYAASGRCFDSCPPVGSGRRQGQQRCDFGARSVVA